MAPFFCASRLSFKFWRATGHLLDVNWSLFWLPLSRSERISTSRKNTDEVGYEKDYSLWGFRWINTTKRDEKVAVPLNLPIHSFLHTWLTLQILTSDPVKLFLRFESILKYNLVLYPLLMISHKNVVNMTTRTKTHCIYNLLFPHLLEDIQGDSTLFWEENVTPFRPTSLTKVTP